MDHGIGAELAMGGEWDCGSQLGEENDKVILGHMSINCLGTAIWGCCESA